MRVAGVDDAGRGSVIGPLVIAGVLLDEKDLPTLVEWGVRDSKLISPRKRQRFSRMIRRLALQCHVIDLTPKEIDQVVTAGRRLHKLNRLEAQTMAKVIAVLEPDVVYVDASDVLANRFGQHIAEDLHFNTQIISEHKADAKYPIVSAASVIAKVERDKAISELREKYGDLGSGYAADQKTMKFLKDWIRSFSEYPYFVRKSWKPAKRLKMESEVRKGKLV